MHATTASDPLVSVARSATFYRSKTVATWLAALLGGFGLHRFYLYGRRDIWAWLHPIPTIAGLYGVERALNLGQDDATSWALIPILGMILAAAMLTAIVYGLTPDDKWNARFNPGLAERASGWAVIFGVIFALFVGSGMLMATLAFSGQRFFEYQVDEARKISQ
jgi:hypothetical protein